MTYLLEITRNCDCDAGLPLKLASGNAFDPASLKVECSKCGKGANVYSAQEVGLDPSNPEFQGRVNALLEGFTALTYYVVEVADRQMIMTSHQRRDIRIPFHSVAECKTCSKTLSGAECSQDVYNAFLLEHKDHGVSTNTVIDTDDPRVMRMIDKAFQNKGRF